VAATQFRSETFVAASDAPLGHILKLRYSGASSNEIKRLVASGKVLVGDQRVLEAHRVVAVGSTIRIEMTTPRMRNEVPEDDGGLVAYVDRELVVVRKPAGISSIIHEDEPVSCEQMVHRWLCEREGKNLPPLGVVHRLDKVTSGIMLFARNQAAKRDLKDQFRIKSTGRLYLAVAHGQLRDQKIAFRLTRNRGDGLRGVTNDPELGRFSVTHVRVLERFSNCCLVQCRLETGRTHQIRIHLTELGNPIVGEPIYTKGLEGPFIEWSRTLLHAETLSFDHPRHRGRLEFTMPPPPEFEAFLKRARAHK
jgi:23S rRNA pseudouridine1911/1915/1917 synthase